ncbi:hypothetical protein ACTFIY_001996 [Dictyostelium cf. discoideum]
MATIMDFLLSQGLNVPVGYSSVGSQTSSSSSIPLDSSLRNVDYLPETDITETKDTLIIECELAGVLKEDISIEVAESKLIIKGDKKRYAYRRPNQSWSYDDKNQISQSSKISEQSSQPEQWQHSNDPNVDMPSSKQDTNVQQSQVGNVPESKINRNDATEPNLPSQSFQSDMNPTSSEPIEKQQIPNVSDSSWSGQPQQQQQQQQPFQQQQSQQQSNLNDPMKTQDSSDICQPSEFRRSNVGESNINQPSSSPSSLFGSDNSQSNDDIPSSKSVEPQRPNVIDSNVNQEYSQSVEQRLGDTQQQSSQLPQQQQPDQPRSNVNEPSSQQWSSQQDTQRSNVNDPSSQKWSSQPSEQQKSNICESNVSQPSSSQSVEHIPSNSEQQSSQLPQQEQQRSNVNEPSSQQWSERPSEQQQQQKPNIGESIGNQASSEGCSGPSVSETRKQFEEKYIDEQQRQPQQQDLSSLHKDEKKPSSSSVSQTAQIFEPNKREEQRQDKPEEKKFDSDIIKSSEPTNVENKDWVQQQQEQQHEPREISSTDQSNVQQPMERQINTETTKEQQQQPQQQEFEERKYISERTFGHFKRTMDLSKMLYRLNLREEVQTHFVNGLLIIIINKKPFEPSIKIPVN